MHLLEAKVLLEWKERTHQQSRFLWNASIPREYHRVSYSNLATKVNYRNYVESITQKQTSSFGSWFCFSIHLW